MFNVARNDLFIPCIIENYNIFYKSTGIKQSYYGQTGIVLSIFTKEVLQKAFGTKKKSCEFLNCGPQTDFWLLKLNVRPEKCFKFDMPVLE